MDNPDVYIERWKAGEEAAAEVIYDLFRLQTFRLAYALLGNQQDAEEVAQDALTYALLNIKRFDPKRSKFSTWLHMITVSRSRDRLRRRQLPTISLVGWLRRNQAADPNPGPEALAEKAEKDRSVWGAVQRLKPPMREALVLRHWGGHTYQEIGEIVGCPLKTAQSRVRLAHEKLEKMLTESEVAESLLGIEQ